MAANICKKELDIVGFAEASFQLKTDYHLIQSKIKSKQKGRVGRQKVGFVHLPCQWRVVWQIGKYQR